MQNGLTFNAPFALALGDAASKLGWCLTFSAGLGNNRRLRLFRSGDPLSADPIADGVEFLNVGLSGAIEVVGSAITGLGITHDVQVRTNADLLTGTCVARMEGNGNWIQGTLGPSRAAQVAANVPAAEQRDYDFTLDGLWDDQMGLAFLDSLIIHPPARLPSGTGPAAPEIDADFPAYFSHEDWTDPANPKITKTVAINQRDEDMVYEDAEMADSIGDVRVTLCEDTIVVGSGGYAFEFGVAVLSINGQANEESDETVHQMVPAIVPFGRWPSWPACDTYVAGYDSTFPAPFKLVYHRADMSVIERVEMHDALAVNDPSLGQIRTGTQALRPHMNMAQTYLTQTHRLKPNKYAWKYHNGVEYVSESAGKSGSSVKAFIPQVLPTANGNNDINSHNNMFAMPRWPLPLDYVDGGAAGNQNHLDPEVADPFLFNTKSYYADRGKPSRATGHDAEPASITGHDRYTGPGGPRFDRHPMPSQLIMFLTEPEGRRLKGMVPWREICDNYGRAMFHHSQYFFRNARTLDTVPTEQMFGTWSMTNGYYGGAGQLYVSGGKSRHIDSFGIRYSAGWPTPDRDGKRHFNGDLRDALHTYLEPGLWTMFMNSPAHTLAHKHNVFYSWCVTLGGSPSSGAQGYFMDRAHSWRWLHYLVGWKIATKHRFGISRATVKQHFRTELETIWKDIYKPCMIDNSQSVYFRSLRAYGVPSEVTSSSDGKYYWKPKTDFKCFYMGTILQLMKTTGCWDDMYAMGGKCSEVMDFIIECFDKFSIDYTIATRGRMDNVDSRVSLSNAVSANIPTPGGWADYAANIFPEKSPIEDWITKADGSWWVGGNNGIDREVSQHLRPQYLKIRQMLFQEYPHPQLDQAVDMYYGPNGWYKKVQDRVDAASTPTTKQWADWVWRMPNLHEPKAPAV